MKLSKHQQGFAAIEASLVVIVLGIIGFTGWFVLHSKQTTQKTYTATESSTVAPTGSTDVKRMMYPRLPSALRTVITTDAQHEDASCVNGQGELVDMHGQVADYYGYYQPNKFAAYAVCGHEHLYEYTNGSWSLLAKTDLAFPCNLLRAHRVPPALLVLSDGGQAICSSDENSRITSPYRL